jgi:hypothetical protein
MKRLTAATVAAAVVLTLVFAASAAAESNLTQTSLRGLPMEGQNAGEWTKLSARLTEASGRAVGGVTLQFFVMTEVFGPRPMKIGEAVTDATGTASVNYKPSWTGQHAVTARFLGNNQYASTETAFPIEVAGIARVHQNAKFGLEPVRALAPVAAISVVASVWVVMAYALVSTVYGVRAGRREEEARAPRLAELGPLGTEVARD